MTEGKLLLTFAEAGELLSMSEHSVRGLVHRGELPSVQVSPRLHRIRRVDLERYVDELGQPTADPSSPVAFFPTLTHNRGAEAAATGRWDVDPTSYLHVLRAEVLAEEPTDEADDLVRIRLWIHPDRAFPDEID